MKVDFSNIVISGIDGKDITIDVSRQLGNALYYSSKDYAMSELGANIYKNKAVDIDKEQATAIVNISKAIFSYVASHALCSLLSDLTNT